MTQTFLVVALSIFICCIYCHQGQIPVITVTVMTVTVITFTLLTVTRITVIVLTVKRMTLTVFIVTGMMWKLITIIILGFLSFSWVLKIVYIMLHRAYLYLLSNSCQLRQPSSQTYLLVLFCFNSMLIWL